MLEKKTGVHVYINVKNFPRIIKKEENNSNDLDHSLHALNTYFRSIEKKSHSLGIEIEKITGSRLHLFIEGNYENDNGVTEKLYEISLFAVNASKKTNLIGKYQSIDKFEIHIGACDGDCYYYTFNDFDDDYEEITSIGYSANVASKLEGCSYANTISLTYNLCLALKMLYPEISVTKGSESFKKYGLNSYYLCNLSNIKVNLNSPEYNDIQTDANNVNLTDIEFEKFKKTINFDDLSIKKCKSGDAIILMVDIRGSTKMFANDDINLEDMTFKMERFFRETYSEVTRDGKGIHVQFQGDKEVSVFSPCYVQEAVIAAFKLKDLVEDIGFKCGIALNQGDIFASRIGVKSEKDSIIIGESVLECDRIEDEYALAGEIVLSKDVYNTMIQNDKCKGYSKFFEAVGGYYKTSKGYQEFFDSLAHSESEENYQKGNYNGAWSE